MTDLLQLILMPDFDSARESLGYEEFDDFDSEDVLYRQGYDGELLEISDEEEFEIGENLIARINSENEYYLLKNKEDFELKQDFVIDDLPPGRYKLCLEENVIYELS